jgi:hypothetical protein
MSTRAPALPSPRSAWRWLAVFGFFLLASVVLTWPLAISLERATGLRGDYFNNLWNFWWLRHSLAEGSSPFTTDLLYYPIGLSLKRHTLSPANALPGALLSSFVSLDAAFNLLLILKLALAGSFFALFASRVTGSLAGGILGGLVYAFNPFHYYYLCQINVFSTEFLPLALYFYVRSYREGGWRNALGAALATGAVTAAHEYYAVYAALVGGLMLVAGKLLDRDVPWRTGAPRLFATLLASGAVVALVAAPLLVGTLGPEGALEGAGEIAIQEKRTNDLLGYNWLGGPEDVTVSWPTMLGYLPLLFVLVLARPWRRELRFWWLVGAVFFVLSLGEKLVVGGRDTGVPLPYALLQDLPVLTMLRKPDRCFAVVELVFALFVAQAWTNLARWLPNERTRLAAGATCAVLFAAELGAAPLARFDYEPPAYFHELAKRNDVQAIFIMPAMDIDVMNARYLLDQTVHGKKMSLGYSTALATDDRHQQQMIRMANGYLWLMGGQPRIPAKFLRAYGVDVPGEYFELTRWIRENGYDHVVHRKTWPRQRDKDERYHKRTVWLPFAFARDGLVWMRQVGQYLDESMAAYMPEVRGHLTRAFGAPEYEDEDVILFRVNR